MIVLLRHNFTASLLFISNYKKCQRKTYLCVFPGKKKLVTKMLWELCFEMFLKHWIVQFSCHDYNVTKTFLTTFYQLSSSSSPYLHAVYCTSMWALPWGNAKCHLSLSKNIIMSSFLVMVITLFNGYKNISHNILQTLFSPKMQCYLNVYF